jgi:hypothetical protein
LYSRGARSNLAHDTVVLTEGFHGVAQSAEEIAGIIPQVGHDHFFPLHQSSCLETESVVNLIPNKNKRAWFAVTEYFALSVAELGLRLEISAGGHQSCCSHKGATFSPPPNAGCDLWSRLHHLIHSLSICSNPGHAVTCHL